MAIPTSKIRQNFNQIPVDQTHLELELRKKVAYLVFWMLIVERQWQGYIIKRKHLFDHFLSMVYLMGERGCIQQ